jgi:hypothetical protein
MPSLLGIVLELGMADTISQEFAKVIGLDFL